MQDYTFGLTPNLPPPDQSTGNISAPGQPAGAAGTPTTTGSKNVGGSTSGIDASKGAITSTGANSLIVDQGVEGSIATEISSDTSLENPEHVFSTSQINFVDSQTQIETLGKEIDILNETGPTFGLASLAVTSALKDTISSSSSSGKIKGDDGTKTEKGERGDDGKKVEGKGKEKGTAEEASPSVGDSVSRAVSPTGEVTTTVSNESVNTSGGVTTNTTTTVSGGGSSSSQGATSGTSTESSPPPEGTINLTQIMDEIGGLESQQSATMAQQQTDQIAAINLQANDSIAGADKLMQGATMMMTMATVGLSVSMATSAYQMGGFASASKEGDEAEMQGMDQQQKSMTTASDTSLHETETATNPATRTKESTATAQRSINQLKQSAKSGNLSEEQKSSYHQQAEASQKSLDNAQYMPDETKESDFNNGKWTSPKDASGDVLKNPDGTAVSTPKEAVDYYNRQARSIATERPQGVSYSELANQGIRPGQTVSKEDAAKYLKTDNPEKIKTFQDNVSKLTINRRSSDWNQAYQNRTQKIGIYAGTGQALAQVFNSAGSMEEQIGNAQQQELQAAAQVEGSTEQAMAQGTQQTQSLAEQFRQSQSAVAQDMSSMVSATRV